MNRTALALCIFAQFVALPAAASTDLRCLDHWRRSGGRDRREALQGRRRDQRRPNSCSGTRGHPPQQSQAGDRRNWASGHTRVHRQPCPRPDIHCRLSPLGELPAPRNNNAIVITAFGRATVASGKVRIISGNGTQHDLGRPHLTRQQVMGNEIENPPDELEEMREPSENQ